MIADLNMGEASCGPSANKGHGPLKRAGLVSGPAAVITVGLFAMMNMLIAVEDIQIDPVPQRILKPVVYTPEPSPEVIVDPVFTAPEVLTPPPPVQVSKVPSEVSLPALVLNVSPPALPSTRRLSFNPGEIRTLGPRGAQALRPPMPVYPDGMARKGVEGSCDVRFDITAQGLPYNVVATCTHPGFMREAVRSVERAEFMPAVIDGQPVGATGLLWPLAFELTAD